MIDLRRMGSGRQLLKTVLMQSSSCVKKWTSTQRLETRKSHKNTNPTESTKK